MATFRGFAAAGYQFESVPDLSRLETRERLSQSAVDGLFAIAEKWGLPIETVGALLGGVPRSSVYKLKTAAGTLRQDELTRISYIVGIYKALHVLLPEELADGWMTRANDNFLFGGQPPLDYVLRMGIPGLHEVRSYLDAARGGR
jgi:Antitoxin Xre/MbcA/ParS C-terminal toxin-binding domain/Antitoxin Xre-like helix-turn-helix domain